MAIGLADLFGHQQWVPLGVAQSTVQTRAGFEILIVAGRLVGGPNAVSLMTMIPVNLTNTFEIEPRSQRGFKFEWADLNGVRWHVHGHEPDAGAQQGHVGGQSWVVRINHRPANRAIWLLAQTLVSQFPPSHANYAAPTQWSGANSAFVNMHSHVPFDP